MIKSIISQNSPLMSLPVKGQLVSLFIHTILITYNFGLSAYHSRSRSKPKLYNVESYDSKRVLNTRRGGTLAVTQVWNNKTVFHRGKMHISLIYIRGLRKNPPTSRLMSRRILPVKGLTITSNKAACTNCTDCFELHYRFFKLST